jgi:hypothetical protein
MNRAVTRDLLLVTSVKAVTSLAVLGTGFRAVSDDDYARVVIAQRFAVEPSWDPSGTSWLPAPFWIAGGVLRLFGRELEVARGVAFASGLLAAVLVYLAARWLGCSRVGSLIAPLLACCNPWFAWLGVATTPDALTASLILAGAAGCASRGPEHRIAGASALLLACWSRYEAWPVALAFALFSAFDAARRRSLTMAAASAIALSGPALWLLHGFTNHGDAWFFVARVVAYRRAHGGANADLLTGIASYPLRLASLPELFALALASVLLAWRFRREAADPLVRYARPGLLLLGLLAFLIVGEVRDGAPTHHSERALLSIWLLFAVLIADVGAQLWASRRFEAAAIASAAICVALVAGAQLARALFGAPSSFVDRVAEVDIGRHAVEPFESARASTPERLLIDTPDFGYFAVIAGFARPEHALPLSDHDPRRGSTPYPGTFEERLHQALRQNAARWLVAPVERASRIHGRADELARNSRYALFELRPGAAGTSISESSTISPE